MKNKFIFCSLFFVFSFNAFGQRDSIKRTCFSVNLIQGLVNQEIGLYYDHRISKKYEIGISYGHRFHNFNIVAGSNYGPNGSYEGDYSYHPQTGDLIRVSLKRIYSEGVQPKNDSYYMARIGYEYLFTPQYWYLNGPSGRNQSAIDLRVENKNLLYLGFGIGHEVFVSKHFFYEVYLSTGFCIGKKDSHVYQESRVSEVHSRITLVDKHYKGTAFFPTIEFGFKIGIH